VLEDIQAQQELLKARTDYVGIVTQLNQEQYGSLRRRGSAVAHSVMARSIEHQGRAAIDGRGDRRGSQMRHFIATLFCAPLLALSALAGGQESAALTLKTRIALPNVNGRIDHLSVDVKASAYS